MGKPRAKPDPWTEDEVKQVKGLLQQFSNDVETVCAVMDCRKEDLNWLCRQAFGPNMTFAKAVAKYTLVGKARLKAALFKAAENGNAKALDMMSREHLDMPDPIVRRHKVMKKVEAKEKETDF